MTRIYRGNSVGDTREAGKVEFGAAAQLQANSGLDELIGSLVEVRTNGADNNHTDKGVLLGFEYPWLTLDSNGDTLCFPIHNIRLVKLVKKLSFPKPTDKLLRPSDGPRE